MQLLTSSSEEGVLPGLGWIRANTKKFRLDPGNSHLKVPHMGWNEVRPVNRPLLFAGYDKIPRFYFVHSYHVCCDDPEDAIGISTHGYEFTAAVGRGNIFGTQFHPEKSHKYGMTLLKNFASL
jgi:glutamine amidotransferase